MFVVVVVVVDVAVAVSAVVRAFVVAVAVAVVDASSVAAVSPVLRAFVVAARHARAVHARAGAGVAGLANARAVVRLAPAAPPASAPSGRRGASPAWRPQWTAIGGRGQVWRCTAVDNGMGSRFD